MNLKTSVLFSLILSLSTFLMGQQELEGTLVHDNLTRDYIIYLPSVYNTGATLPLVFNFHGFTSNASDQKLYSGMNAVAEEEGFIVCYPNGIGNAWNVDWTFGSTADDIGFTDALIGEFIAQYQIDISRVYACGMSNGGFFSYQLACQLPERITAVASVTGSFSPNMMNTCNPSRKVPVMEIHGTSDFTVAYNGTPNVSIAVEDVIDFWVNHNSCTDDPLIDMYPDLNTGDNTTITRTRYHDCADDSEVYLLKVLDGGHTWPGATIAIPGLNTNMDISASQEIWEFFKRHQYQESTATKSLSSISEPRVFPNPTHEILNISTSDQSMSYKLYSITGQEIILTNNGHQQIDMSALKSGVYLLVLSNQDQSWIKRIIKR